MISRRVQSLVDRRTLTGIAQWVCIYSHSSATRH